MNKDTSMINTKTVIQLIGKEYENELLHSIAECKFYKSKSKHFPSVSAVAYLYIKDNMKFALGDAEDGLIFISESNIETFIKHLYRKAIVDLSTVKSFLESFDANMVIIDSKVDLTEDEIERWREMLQYVAQNYWESRLHGAYDKVMDIERYQTAFIFSDPGREVAEIMKKTMKVLPRVVSNNTDISERIQVERPKDLTLIIDISFKKGERIEKVTLLSSSPEKKRLPVNKLLTEKEMDFLLEAILSHEGYDFFLSKKSLPALK